MYTPDPKMAQIVAAAREQLQTQLIYLENALDQKEYGTKTTPIYGLIFFIVGTELHYTGDPDGFLPVDSETEISAYELFNNAGLDSVFMNDLSQAIMNWFANPTYQE